MPTEFHTDSEVIVAESEVSLYRELSSGDENRFIEDVATALTLVGWTKLTDSADTYRAEGVFQFPTVFPVHREPPDPPIPEEDKPCAPTWAPILTFAGARYVMYDSYRTRPCFEPGVTYVEMGSSWQDSFGNLFGELSGANPMWDFWITYSPTQIHFRQDLEVTGVGTLLNDSYGSGLYWGWPATTIYTVPSGAGWKLRSAPHPQTGTQYDVGLWQNSSRQIVVDVWPTTGGTSVQHVLAGGPSGTSWRLVACGYQFVLSSGSETDSIGVGSVRGGTSLLVSSPYRPPQTLQGHCVVVVPHQIKQSLVWGTHPISAAIDSTAFHTYTAGVLSKNVSGVVVPEYCGPEPLLTSARKPLITSAYLQFAKPGDESRVVGHLWDAFVMTDASAQLSQAEYGDRQYIQISRQATGYERMRAALWLGAD